MQRFITSRRFIIALVALSLTLVATIGGALIYRTSAANAPAYIALAGSNPSAVSGAHPNGNHPGNSMMSIAIALTPRDEAAMNNQLAAMYDPSSTQFHQWLAKGEFVARYAPSAASVSQVKSFLQHAGLHIDAVSPFLIRASGTTAKIEAAFRTHIGDFTSAKGVAYYSNDQAVQVPASLQSTVAGVVGLSNTARLHSNYVITKNAAKQQGRAVPHYGAGPGGSGLTPSQTTSIYGAQGVYAAGNRGKGAGKTLAVFELSGYLRSDIQTYEHTFFGASENVPLVDVNVDGGPVTPNCPTGDTCNPANDFSGDIEVEADIQQQIALAPKINGILVYNAPNDFNGVTAIDEYSQIAADDFADSISSSWALCEQDAGLANIQAESVAFRQMAMQGQSMFASSGDTGPFECLRDVGSPNLTAFAVLDPSSQPFVTAVGGTSFGTFDPGTNQHPAYPTGAETVWNPLGLCSGTPNGQNNCVNFGAGGGGNSDVWGRPGYQSGPGVNSSFNQKAPFCTLKPDGSGLLKAGTPCRSTPDVSADADEFTPYAEFCTGNPATNSTCATFSGGQPAPGWFGIGGTSLSSPVWSGIVALWDSFHNARFGNANPELYELFRAAGAYNNIYHDITGINQQPNNNGFFPVTRNYDEATGIGTPRITGFAKSNP